MARVALPPTPLASNLVATLLLHTAARFNRVLDIRREPDGVLAIHIDTEPQELARMITISLGSRELRPEEVGGALPLIPGTAPGTDGRVLSELLSRIGISRPSLRAVNRAEIYDSLVRLIERNRGELANSISTLSISVSRGVLEIKWGSAQHPVPAIIKSEAFYEIGRFGGASDRKRGRPDIGRVDYRASTSLTALLYALLLALQTGYEAGITNMYMFTAIQLEPGKVAGIQAKLINRIYMGLLDEIQRVGLRTWSQDYEGLRLASILKLAELYTELGKELLIELPSNVLFNHIVIGATGRRFFPLWSVSVSASELDTVVRAVKSFADELQVDMERALRMLKMLIIATLKIMTRSTSSSARELWQGIRILVYSFIEGRRYELLDSAYRMVRLLSDTRTGLRSELIGTVTNTARDLGIDLESLLLEHAEDRGTALWKTLRRLINVIVL